MCSDMKMILKTCFDDLLMMESTGEEVTVLRVTFLNKVLDQI